MRYLFLRNKFFSIALICSVLAIVVVGFTAVNINRWSYEIREARSGRIKNQLLIDNFEKQLNLYKSGFGDTVRRLSSVRPTKDELVAFLTSMDTLAGKTGIKNFSLKSLGELSAKDSAAPAVLFQASFEASQSSLKNFFEGFDRLPVYAVIDDFSAAAVDSQPLHVALKAVIKFHIFTRNEP